MQHSVQQTISQADLRVKVIPALSDNFMYLLIDEGTQGTRQAAAVDPVNPELLLEVVKEEDVKLTHVLTTHHHWDHAGGNEQLVKLVRDKLVVCGADDRIGALNHPVKEGDTVQVGSLSVRCMSTPCHTSGHICYFVDSTVGQPLVFTGDTLFSAGCGRFFEGTPDQMYEALVIKLGNLPPNTNVFCGHEYTVKNLQYALHAEPGNTDAINRLKWAKEQRAQKLPTIPSTIQQEFTFNPFMRVCKDPLQKHASTTDPIQVMKYIRKEKDDF